MSFDFVAMVSELPCHAFKSEVRSRDTAAENGRPVSAVLGKSATPLVCRAYAQSRQKQHDAQRSLHRFSDFR